MGCFFAYTNVYFFMILFTLFKKSVIIRCKMNRLTKWYKIIQLIARKESKETDELDYRWNYPINIGESVQY